MNTNNFELYKTLNLMGKIKLNDILRFENLDNVKFRFNLSNSSWNALDLYHNDKEKLLIGNFANSRSKKWFKEEEIVIGLAKIKNNDWLLIDISRITKRYDKVWNDEISATVHTFYEHEKIQEFEKYFGRLIVQYHKTNAYVTLSGTNIDSFIIKEILPDTYDDEIFPGYDKVNISWEQLFNNVEKESWATALQNQKGVYLITDTSNGKKYVGSAYDEENMILGRWKTYVKNGHGGNKRLKELPLDHIKENFTFSILDIYKSTTDDQIIIDRESWWKEVLQSKSFGYNEN